jgi:V/A-type H+-transporting ATPase subunit I
MLSLFGISNFLWGIFTCSWFGLDTAILPAVLRSLALPLISTAAGTPQEVVDKNLMTFCFSIALSQLTIAHIMSIVTNIKNRNIKFFADIGQLAMLWGMYDVVLSLVVNGGFGYVHMPMMYLMSGGFLLVFIFGYYEGSVGKSVISSVKNIISVVLGITNVFSDIMSYIRLWAVGLAGASIAQTVNSMAGPMVTHLAFAIFGIVLFGFGHCFNMVLNVLSVLVHGVRLNTLEFSTHVGLGWTGFAYKPFAKRAQ